MLVSRLVFFAYECAETKSCDEVTTVHMSLIYCHLLFKSQRTTIFRERESEIESVPVFCGGGGGACITL